MAEVSNGSVQKTSETRMTVNQFMSDRSQCVSACDYVLQYGGVADAFILRPLARPRLTDHPHLSFHKVSIELNKMNQIQ